jgi:hypothetical protein
VNQTSRVLKRFWWLIAIGFLFALAAAVLSIYRADFSSIPPKLSERAHPTYTTAMRLLVTSSERPYVRTSIPRPVVSPTTDPTQILRPGAQLPTEAQAPDYQVLLFAANLYPWLIESDPVADLRTQLYGEIPGTVTATTIGAVMTPNRVETSRIPVIQIVATSDSPRNAIALAQRTGDAFIEYIERQQGEGLKAKEKIVVQPLRAPREPFAAGGTSMSLPMLVVVALTMAFVALAFLLDRLFPRRVTVPASREDFLRADEDDEPLLAASSRRDA